MSYYIKLFRTKFKDLESVEKFISLNAINEYKFIRGFDSWAGRLPQKKIITLESNISIFKYENDNQEFQYIPVQFLLERTTSPSRWVKHNTVLPIEQRLNEFSAYGVFVLDDDQVDFYIMGQNKDEFHHVIKFQIEQYEFTNGNIDLFSSDCLLWLFKRYKTNRKNITYQNNIIKISELLGYSGKPTDLTVLTGSGDQISNLISTEAFLVLGGQLTDLNLVFSTKEENVTFSISINEMYTFSANKSYGNLLMLKALVLKPIILSILLAKVIYPSIIYAYKQDKHTSAWNYEVKRKYLDKLVKNIIRQLRLIYKEEYTISES